MRQALYQAPTLRQGAEPVSLGSSLVSDYEA